MEERGMDTVFYIYNGETDNKMYLLTDWASASPMTIDAWVTVLHTGVPTNGSLQPICNYKPNNLKWNGCWQYVPYN
jgi:hypothetical protein